MRGVHGLHANTGKGYRVTNIRCSTQRRHEQAVISKFLAWLNHRRGYKYQIIEGPDPPDAIIKSVRVTRWVEVTDAYLCAEYARDLHSEATPGEEHIPIRPGPYSNMDMACAQHLVDVVAKKIQKNSYAPFVELYGPGYLVVSAQSPFFDDQTLRLAKAIWAEGRPWTDKGYFKEIYIRSREAGSWPFRKWNV